MPAHGSVFQGHDLVGNTGVDQRLRADDRTRPPGAIDHDGSVRIGRQVVHAIGQLRPRAIDARGDIHLHVFGHGPGVENDHFLAPVHHGLDLFGRHARGVVGMFDEFAERLGRQR